MDDTIKILKHEHVLIEQAMERILPFAKDCTVKPEDWDAFEKLILRHVSKEDLDIYIPLRRLIKLDPDAEKFFLLSRQELEDLKISAIVFFEKYKGEKNAVDCQAFKRDFDSLANKIKKRIDFENKELFPFFLGLWQ